MPNNSEEVRILFPDAIKFGNFGYRDTDENNWLISELEIKLDITIKDENYLNTALQTDDGTAMQIIDYIYEVDRDKYSISQIIEKLESL